MSFHPSPARTRCLDQTFRMTTCWSVIPPAIRLYCTPLLRASVVAGVENFGGRFERRGIAFAMCVAGEFSI